MTHYIDTQLKQALAKMLPEKLFYEGNVLGWKRYPDDNSTGLHYAKAVLDTELLHLCWLVEDTQMEPYDIEEYTNTLREVLIECWTPSRWEKFSNNGHAYAFSHASWQQRTIALAKVKGVEIV